MNNPQGVVYSAVEDRGYTKGWTDEQFAARQMAKLIEEMGELSELAKSQFGVPPAYALHLHGAAVLARDIFDKGDWGGAVITSVEKAKEELADIQVVLFCMAEAISRMENEEFDIIKSAVSKAIGDITRGVRGAETD